MQFNNKMKVPSDETLKAMAYDAKKSDNHKIKWNQWTWAMSCLAWKEKRRPYLCVWPTVEHALLRSEINVDPGLIPPGVIHNLLAMEVRFSDASGQVPFMLTITEERYWRVNKDSAIYEKKVPGVFVTNSVTEDTKDHTDIVVNGAGMPFGEVTKEPEFKADTELIEELRLAVGILLLAADVEYCTPMLLNRDKDRSLTGGDLERAIERARRNGKFGFDIGKSIETSPHFRRPHFAIRWTGKGANIPRLVPVKGSIVNKKLLGNIPTGYEDDNS